MKNFKWMKLKDGVEFNQKVRDITTGFEGIVHAKCSYRTGCVHVEVQPTTLDNGKIRKSEWIDETLLEVWLGIDESPSEIKERKLKEKKKSDKEIAREKASSKEFMRMISRSHGGPNDSPPKPSRHSVDRPDMYDRPDPYASERGE